MIAAAFSVAGFSDCRNSDAPERSAVGFLDSGFLNAPGR